MAKRVDYWPESEQVCPICLGTFKATPERIVEHFKPAGVARDRLLRMSPRTTLDCPSEDCKKGKGKVMVQIGSPPTIKDWVPVVLPQTSITDELMLTMLRGRQ